MESASLNSAQAPGLAAAELVEDLPEWKPDSTFQHRVNNVCTKLLRKGVRPTYQRVRAHVGQSPARLLREALQTWTAKVLPDLYAAPKVEWADRPKAIPPRVAELFEEMWLQAVSAAQVHYELGDDSGARLTHRELIDAVFFELRRLNTKGIAISNAAQHLEQGMAAQRESMRDARADIQSLLRALELEIASIRDSRRDLDETLSKLKLESERQSDLLKQHADICLKFQQLERARSARVRRLAAKLMRNSHSPRGRRIRREAI